MKTLGIDIETYCDLPLADCGVYRYAESPEFRLLLFGYSADGGEPRCVDIARGEELPPEVLAALADPAVEKTAYNAQFERVCLSRWLGLPPGQYLDPAQWRCTMAAAARLGFPLGLAQCAQALRMEEGKMEEGRALIRYFSQPWRGKRHLPADAPDRWELFKQYNLRDVQVEQAILRRTAGIVPQTETERALYVADQRINDRGVLVDRRLAANADRLDSLRKEQLAQEARRLTGLDNPNAPGQLKEWIGRRTGMAPATLAKGSLEELERRMQYFPDVRRVLQIRRELGKTSTRKYRAMLDCACADSRIRGLLQFHGAVRTGRWAGRLVQVQNLPQNHLGDLDVARRAVLTGDLDTLSLLYDDPAQTLSELVRTAFVAPPGCTLHVCDFSAIEARVVAWLAGEEWVLDVFRRGGDIYCATASQMFRVPVEKHGRNAELRPKGKVSVLALGYGGGTAALRAMGGERLGMTEEEMADTVRRWREANPAIVRLWGTLEKAAMRVITRGGTAELPRGLRLSFARGLLLIQLPSGRALCYPRAAVGEEENDGWRGTRPVIEYEGTDQLTRKWGKQRTYGGKLTENVTQAVARDLLAHVILQAERAGIRTVFHVHDEIVAEAPASQPLGALERLFSQPPAWAAGLPLSGAGYETPYYKKD